MMAYEGNVSLIKRFLKNQDAQQMEPFKLIMEQDLYKKRIQV
jgi:hypothetical protein